MHTSIQILFVDINLYTTWYCPVLFYGYRAQHRFSCSFVLEGVTVAAAVLTMWNTFGYFHTLVVREELISDMFVGQPSQQGLLYFQAIIWPKLRAISVNKHVNYISENKHHEIPSK